MSVCRLHNLYIFISARFPFTFFSSFLSFFLILLPFFNSQPCSLVFFACSFHSSIFVTSLPWTNSYDLKKISGRPRTTQASGIRFFALFRRFYFAVDSFLFFPLTKLWDICGPTFLLFSLLSDNCRGQFSLTFVGLKKYVLGRERNLVKYC